MPPDQEHPCHGASPYLKLVTQPPTQLPVTFASSASFADTDIGVVDDVWVVVLRRASVLRATVRCISLCGLVTCFGTSIMTLGSEPVALPEGVAACDIPVPPRLYINSAIDELVAARPDENLMAVFSRCGCNQPLPWTHDITF